MRHIGQAPIPRTRNEKCTLFQMSFPFSGNRGKDLPCCLRPGDRPVARFNFWPKQGTRNVIQELLKQENKFSLCQILRIMCESDQEAMQGTFFHFTHRKGRKMSFELQTRKLSFSTPELFGFFQPDSTQDNRKTVSLWFCLHSV